MSLSVFGYVKIGFSDTRKLRNGATLVTYSVNTEDTRNTKEYFTVKVFFKEGEIVKVMPNGSMGAICGAPLKHDKYKDSQGNWVDKGLIIKLDNATLTFFQVDPEDLLKPVDATVKQSAKEHESELINAWVESGEFVKHKDNIQDIIDGIDDDIEDLPF